MLGDYIVEQQICLIFHVLNSNFILISDFVAIEAYPVAEFKVAVEKKHENQHENQVKDEFTFVISHPMHIRVVWMLHREISSEFFVKFAVNNSRCSTMIPSNDDKNNPGNQCQNVLHPTVELYKVTKVNQTYEQHESVIKLNRGKFLDVNERKIYEN